MKRHRYYIIPLLFIPLVATLIDPYLTIVSFSPFISQPKNYRVENNYESPVSSCQSFYFTYGGGCRKRGWSALEHTVGLQKGFFLFWQKSSIMDQNYRKVPNFKHFQNHQMEFKFELGHGVRKMRTRSFQSRFPIEIWTRFAESGRY